MRLSAVAFCMILTTIFLSACGQQNMAAVDEKGDNFYSRNGVLSLSGASHLAQAEPVIAPQAPYQVVQHTVPSRTERWQWPVQGSVTESYGDTSDGMASEGIVISAAAGSPIKAAQSGEVAFVGKNTKTFGNMVILRHADGDMSSYAYARNIIVAKGEQVKAGDILGYVGQTGNAQAPQLHFAVRENGKSIDPMSKLPQHVAMN